MNKWKYLPLAVLLVGLVVTAGVAGTKWIKFDGSISDRMPAVNVTANSAEALAFTVRIPTFDITEVEAEDEVWQQIQFKTASVHSMPGEPELPVLSRLVAVPRGAKAKITVTPGQYRVIDGVHPYPAQEPPVDCYTGDDPSFSCGDVYEQDAYFPGELYRVEGPFTIRGLQMLQLNLYPVQVNPVTEKATLYADLNVTVEFVGGKGTFFSDRRGRSFQHLYNQTINGMAFAGEPLPQLTGKSPTGAEFVIVTAPDFADAAADLAEWKILQGYDTEIFTTDETGTTCEAVKTWVQDAYDTWDPAPEFILFFGDAEFINPCYEVYDYGEYIGSDVHFCQVDGDDEWPDIAHARISVDTAAQAQKRVDDIVMYERTPITDDSYYTSTTQAAYFQTYGNTADRRFCRTSEEMYQWFNFAMDDSPFTAERIYVTGSSYSPLYWNQATYNWTPDWWWDLGYDDYNIPPDLLRSNGFAWDGGATQIAASVNAGVAFITHRDHGDVDGWSDPAFNNTDAAALVNGDKLPVLWSINCLTGYFDNETGSSGHSMAFTEEWERNANGGAVGILASTRVSYSGRNDRMVWGWLDSHWPEFEPNWPETDVPNEPEWRMGHVLNYGKMYMSHHYVDDPYRLAGITEFHWFGDPTMEMWAGVPGEMTVSSLPIIPMGAASFDVDVDVDGALVALVQDGTILGKAYSSAGTAHVAFDGPVIDVEDVNLTVTRRNYRPFEDTIMVGATQDGVVNLDRNLYTENHTINVSVSDADLIGEGTFTLHIDSDTETAGEDIVCTELVIVDPTGTFFGSIEVTTAGPADANGVLSIGDGDTITLYYHDDDTGSGPADKTDTAYADTAAPTFAGAAGAVGADHKVTVTWGAATDLTPPITYQIYRAESSGGQNFAVPLTQTSDTTYVNTGLPNMVEFFYVVRATDALGHQDTNTVEVSDYTIGPVTFWEEDFDDDPDGIPDTWEIIDGGRFGATYRWNTSNYGERSSSQWSGLFAIADSDETGSGPEWDDYLITESINAGGYTGIRLLFTHYYRALSGDAARLEISIDGGDTWEVAHDFTGTSREQAEDIDLSEWADNQADVKLAFYYAGNYDWWWGIDNLEMIGQVADNPPVINDFAIDVATGDAPLEVTFTPNTTGLIGSYEWDFGDGNGSSEATPTHSYTEVGTYSVTLAVTSPYGDDELTKDSAIDVVCPAPTVAFGADVVDGQAPLEVQFTDLSETYAGCGATALEWDFGDGDTAADTSNPAHTYDAAGTYTVALTYTTDYGTFTETKTDLVNVTCGVPDAGFTADVTTGDAPLTVQFTDASATPGNCDISAWVYGYGTDLDDLTIVSEQNPTITFTEPGVYHVALRTTNAAGHNDEVKEAFITVNEPSTDDDTTDDDATDDDAVDDDAVDDDATDDDATDDDATDDDTLGDDDDDDDDDDEACGC